MLLKLRFRYNLLNQVHKTPSSWDYATKLPFSFARWLVLFTLFFIPYISLLPLLHRKLFYNIEYGNRFSVYVILKQTFIFSAYILINIMEMCNQLQNNYLFCPLHFTLSFKDSCISPYPYIISYFNCCPLFHGV